MKKFIAIKKGFQFFVGNRLNTITELKDKSFIYTFNINGERHQGEISFFYWHNMAYKREFTTHLSIYKNGKCLIA